jgi:hypothetical protein
MKKLMGVFMAVGLAFAANACNKDKDAAPAAAPAGDKKPTDTAAKPADKPADPAAKPAAPAAGGDIGVAECDDYLGKMKACSEKMQPEARGPMQESMATMSKAWKDASSTPEGKTALAAGCKQALDAAKSAYGSMGCTF